MSRRTLPALALAATLAAGCAETRTPAAAAPASTGSASTAPAPARTANVYRFKIGALDAVALYDGAFRMPNDGKTFGVDEGAERVGAVLRAAGLPSDSLGLSVNVLLVRTGERLFMIDTGNGPGAAGRLPASLREAGIAPADVTDIVITHGHGDHVGGLVGADGAAAFPNARVHMTAAEWAAVRPSPRAAAVVAAVGARVVTFAPGATLAPGITAADVRGHTPGHTAVLVESGGQRLIAIGDAAHHYVVSLREPEFTLAYDADAPTAEASRRALLTRAVDERLTVYAPHFPYPGVGTVRREGDGFAWVPRP